MKISPGWLVNRWWHIDKWHECVIHVTMCHQTQVCQCQCHRHMCQSYVTIFLTSPPQSWPTSNHSNNQIWSGLIKLFCFTDDLSFLHTHLSCSLNFNSILDWSAFATFFSEQLSHTVCLTHFNCLFYCLKSIQLNECVFPQYLDDTLLFFPPCIELEQLEKLESYSFS